MDEILDTVIGICVCVILITASVILIIGMLHVAGILK